MGRLAFLFLTIAELRKEEWWSQFFHGIDPLLYRIYNHAKFPEDIPKHSLLYQRQITRHIPTRWADISLVDASLSMMEEAVQDPENDFFILVSESCIPVQSFKMLYTKLYYMNTSLFQYNPYYFETRESPQRYHYFQGKSYIPRWKFRKHHQWFILTRRDALVLTQSARPFLKDFSKMFAPDEHFFLNMMDLFGLTYKNHGTTYVNFSSSNSSHPQTFTTLAPSFFQILHNMEFFFLRKVDEDCKIQEN